MPQSRVKTTPTSEERELRQKMAQSIAGAAPSMVPAPRESRSKKTDETPVLDDLMPDGEESKTLKALIKQHMELNRPKKELEKKLEFVSDRIKVILSSHGISGNFTYEDIPVNYFSQSRSTINALKLEALGVDVETIRQATDVSISTILKITPPK
jgi:hypothetical protein